MTVEEMQAQLDKMKDDVEHMKVRVSEYEHMISAIKAQIEDDKDCFGYEWNTKDGKIVTLFVKIKERDENETD